LREVRASIFVVVALIVVLFGCEPREDRAGHSIKAQSKPEPDAPPRPDLEEFEFVASVHRFRGGLACRALEKAGVDYRAHTSRSTGILVRPKDRVTALEVLRRDAAGRGRTRQDATTRSRYWRGTVERTDRNGLPPPKVATAPSGWSKWTGP